MKSRVIGFEAYILDQLCNSGQFIFKRNTPNTQISSNGIATIKSSLISFLQRQNVELFTTADYLPEQLTLQGKKIIELIKN